VPIALLRSPLRRSGSIFIVFEVITFGYGREESVMSRLAPIYTIYGRLYTTFGLGGRHTGRPNGLPVGSTDLMGVYLMGMYLMSVHLMSVYSWGVYLVGVHLNGVYLTGMHPTDVRLINVHLTGVYLIGMYLTGMHLTGMHL
jgi:hypothetical protein